MALQSIETLLNGTIFFISDGNLTGHVYPPLVYQAIPEQSIVRIIDNFNTIIPIDISIDFINGVAFSGNYAQLQIDIEAAVDAANIEFENFNSAVSGGSATADNQVLQIDQITNYLGKKAIGKIVDLAADQGGTWNGYPITFLLNEQIGFNIKIDNVEYPIPNDMPADSAAELVSLLNTSQSYLSFEIIDETHLLISDGTLSIASLEQFYINSANNGVLLYETFPYSPAIPLSNLDEMNERLKSVEANIQAVKQQQTNGTQKTQIFQDGLDVGKNNGASIKFSNDSITQSASGALLVTTTFILFDGKTLNADDTNFLWQGVGTGTGAWANNMFSMSVTAGQYYIRQSRRFMPYFSGYPVLAELTFDNFDIQSNGTKRLGYFSSSATQPYTANLDGFWIEMDGTTYRMISYNNGTQTSNIPFTSFTNYAALSAYNFDNFTACMFSFLWLGGAQLALWLCTADGWILANTTPYIGNNKGTICKSPNQPVRYEIRSTTGVLDFRQICSQVSVGGSNIDRLGYVVPSINTTAIACNAIGTIYALQGFKKNATYRDIAVKIESFGVVNEGTSDTGMLLLIRNPTLSAALTYAAYGKIDRAIATTQTVTVGTGDILGVVTAGTAGNANGDLTDNYKSWLTQTITNTFDEYVLGYLSTSSNQSNRGYAILKEY
jgi:hypothetical protein